jgi:hypothetical protein
MAPLLQDAITTKVNLTPRRVGRPLIAPAWHTILFIAIFVGLSVAGGFFQHAAKQRPHATATAPSSKVVTGYISVTVLEWLLVLYVRKGVHKRGVRVRDLVGGRWATPKAVMVDIALGAGLWALWIGIMRSHVLGGGTNAAQGLLPQGFFKAWRGYPLPSRQDFARNSPFAAIFRGNFKRSLEAPRGQSLSRQLYSASATSTRGQVRSRGSRCSASCSDYSLYGGKA